MRDPSARRLRRLQSRRRASSSITGACGSAERAMELVRAGASMKAIPIILGVTSVSRFDGHRQNTRVCPVSCVTVDTSGRTVSTVPLEGGHLALDFVNTVGGLRDDAPSAEEELFDSYEDVATWCARVI